MNIKGLISSLITDSVFPSDVTRIPLITIKGNEHFVIENEYTLQYFSIHKIIIKYDKGLIEINGSNMIIKTMVKEEIILHGNIDSIQFI